MRGYWARSLWLPLTRLDRYAVDPPSPTRGEGNKSRLAQLLADYYFPELLTRVTSTTPGCTDGRAAGAERARWLARMRRIESGEPPMDIEALSAAVVKIGELMRDASAKVMSIDLNPVMLNTDGCVVVDAVVFKGE